MHMQFFGCKNEIFHWKKIDIFLIFAPKHKYTPAYPSFFLIKVGFKEVFIAQTCFPDVKLCLTSSHMETVPWFKVSSKRSLGSNQRLQVNKGIG